MTKFYLHDAASGVGGILPDAEQSSLTASINFEGSQTTNRSMDTNIGTSQASRVFTGNMATTSRNYYVTRFVSPLIYQTSIAANTWQYAFAHRQTSTSCNFPVTGNNQAVRINIYVWQPSTGTKIGTILDGNTSATVDEGAVNTEIYHIVNFAGAEVTGLTSGDAVIIIEIWFVVTSTITTSQTLTFFYDGTTESAENATATSAASNINTPEDINLTELVPVSNDITQIFAIRNEVPKELTQLYSLRSITNKESTQIWSLRNIISKESTQIWNLRNIISKESIQRYTMLQTISKECIQIWNIAEEQLTAVFNEITQIYAIRQQISKESIQRFNIFNIISKESSQIYAMMHTIARESNQIYSILQQLEPVFREITQIYSIRKSVFKELIQKYKIAQIIIPFKRKYPRGYIRLTKPLYTYFTKGPGPFRLD